MEKILLLRQRMKQLYSKYDIYVLPVLKFLVMLTVLLLLNRNLGYRELLTSWTIVLVVSLVASLMSWSVMSFVAAAFLVGHLSALSWEATGICLVFLFVAGVLHYLFLPGCSIVIVLIPAAYFLHIPYVVPLVLGLVGGATSFIPAGLGVFAYFFLGAVQKNAGFLADAAQEHGDILERTILHLTQILSGLRDNNLMFLSIAAFCVTVALVQGIRRISADYAPYVAIVVGAIANVLVFMVGGFAVNASVPYVEMILGTLLGVIVAVAVQFWLVAMDYSRTEYLQYEDDEYVYFVKAVPKISLAKQEIKVQEINARVEDEDSDIREALGMLDELENQDR